MRVASGLASGGVWGVVEGLRHPDAVTPRLRFNSVLNSVTRRGPFLGNTWGVVGARPAERTHHRFVLIMPCVRHSAHVQCV